MKFIVENQYLSDNLSAEFDLESQIQEFFEFVYKGRNETECGLEFSLTKEVSDKLGLQFNIRKHSHKCYLGCFIYSTKHSIGYGCGSVFEKFSFSKTGILKSLDHRYDPRIGETSSLEKYENLCPDLYSSSRRDILSQAKKEFSASMEEIKTIDQIFWFLNKFFHEYETLFYFSVISKCLTYFYQIQDSKEILRIINENSEKYSSQPILDAIYHNYPVVFYLSSFGQLKLLEDPAYQERAFLHLFLHIEDNFTKAAVQAGNSSYEDKNLSDFALKIRELMYEEIDRKGYFYSDNILQVFNEKIISQNVRYQLSFLIDNIFSDCLVYEFPMTDKQKEQLCHSIGECLGYYCGLIAKNLFDNKKKIIYKNHPKKAFYEIYSY